MKLDSCSGNCVITGLGPSISTISGSTWIDVPDPKLAEAYIAECSVDGKDASWVELIMLAPFDSLSPELDKCLRGSDAKAGGVRVSALDIVTKWFPNTFFSNPVCNILEKCKFYHNLMSRQKISCSKHTLKSKCTWAIITNLLYIQKS